METPEDSNGVPSGPCVDGGRSVVYELPLGEAAAAFDLQKAVCSHGFFMTAPNHWDPLSKTLRRPLRLFHDGVASSSSVTVQISQPSHSSHLLLRVFDTGSLSPAHRQSLMEQVKRMLRLSEEEERNVREFQKIYGEAKATGFGRVFRSPTLFEDMIKCILVCNCQWSRTLSMARALCELQLELQCPTSNASFTEGDKLGSPTTKTKQFAPKTPVGKERTKSKIRFQGKSTNLPKRSVEVKVAIEADAAIRLDYAETSNSLREKENTSLGLDLEKTEDVLPQKREYSCETSMDRYEANFSGFVNELSGKTQLPSLNGIGNFPSPEELASLDVNFLAKRCNLGYRASRIVGLAQSVVEGRVQLRQLEEDCGEATLSNYIKLTEQLEKINGFGPFTCANVLMCMGFYHVVPSDSETLRHLNQVHGKKSTIKSIQQDIEMIYGKYAPFQFLVYWSEIWSFYEERFGKLSELPYSDYKLITAANMRCKNGTHKKTKRV